MSRSSIVVLLIAVVISVSGYGLGQAQQQPQPVQAEPKWEYKVIQLPRSVSSADVGQKLNEIAAEDWEL